MIHGTLKAAPQFHGKFVSDPQEFGSIINPHDPCVANKAVTGKQMTIVWHVDDAKASHVDSQELNVLVHCLKNANEDPEIGMMTANQGDAHDFRNEIGLWQ